MTESAKQSLAILRDPSLFQWYVIPIFVIVFYIYSAEIGKRNWSVVLGGLAFWGMDWFNEIWNGLVLHFTRYSACWLAPGKTAYLILCGLNIEICLMFAVLGPSFLKTLPKDKKTKILGIPNRPFLIVVNSIMCVAIEVILNRADALVWDYWWWNFPFVLPIVVVGYMPFMAAAFFVHDMEKMKNKIIAVSAILGVDAFLFLLFAFGLKWI